MPIPYQTSSGTPVRSRRIRDKDGRITTSRSDSVKKSRDSRSSNRTPPHSLRPAQPFLYTQHNVTLDQLPSLPGSGTASPSAASPVLRASTSTPTAPATAAPVFATPIVSSAIPYTPIALQPYLDTEEDAEPSDLDTSKPSQQLDEVSKVRSISPKPTSHPPEPLISIPHSTPSPHSAETALRRSPSPLPPATSTHWDPPHLNQLQSGLSIFEPSHSYSQIQTYVTSPPQFTPAAPFLPVSNEQYYPPLYGGSPYMPLTQPTGSVHEFQPGPPPPVPYFANYASPQQIQAPYHSMRSSSIRGRSSGSRKSFSGEPFPSAPPPMANPPEQTLLAESLAPASQGAEDESIDLLQRIQSAIPDLHLLLNRYKETSGQLGVRETLIRETEAQKAAALKQKEAHIEKLEKEMENVSNKHSAESSKLRLEVGNMEEKHKELQDSLGNMEGKHKELQGSLIAEKDSKAELELAYRTVKAEKEQLERRLQEERANINHEINLWNQKTSQNQADLQSSWEIDLKRLKQESEARLQAREAQLSESWELERSSLQAGWATQKREIEDSHSRLRRDWEATLDSRQKTIEECRRKQSQDREAWNRERDALSRSWGEERTLLGKGWAEQRTILTAQHQNEKDELERKLRDSHAQAIKTAEERQTKLEKENERIKTGWEADKAKFSKATADLKNAAAKLNDENVKLQKLAEAFGDVTDLKSREDPFYDDAFHHLHKQVLDLTLEHFQGSIETPPKNIIECIPSTIPLFLSSSKSSITIRAAYVEHIVSSIITRRIFKPFLFTSSLRRGSSDKLFQSWSDHMRSKSTRREALWRQRTLHAAYTVSCAKQSINKIAAIIVDEIVDAIKYFANPTRWEQLTMAVRRIVKTAAETWRYARLEIPMITASMSEEDRPDFMRSRNTPTIGPTLNGASGPRHVLLPLFPIIEREAIHEDIREDARVHDQGYTYYPGRALDSDDPAVVGCLAENQRDHKSPSPHGGGISHRSESLGASPLASTQPDWPLPNPPTASFRAQSEFWAAMDVNPTSRFPPQIAHESHSKRSDGSNGRTPSLSHSSVTSNSSTGKSTSTTRPEGLPNWGSKDGADDGGHGGW